ncbi:MAG TPA: hypothetical protein PL066_03095 [bacterium]|nr:hypothetical protein [bacterium]
MQKQKGFLKTLLLTIYRMKFVFRWRMLVNAGMFAVVLSLAVYYLVQVNNLAITGYSIRDYEKNIADLENDIKRLELTIAQKQSVSDLQTKLGSLQLESLNNLVYINASDVALK